VCRCFKSIAFLALVPLGDPLYWSATVILAAVQQNGRALQFADDSFKRDRDVVLAAVQQNGRALQFADESFKRDRDVVLAAGRHGA